MPVPGTVTADTVSVPSWNSGRKPRPRNGKSAIVTTTKGTDRDDRRLFQNDREGPRVGSLQAFDQPALTLTTPESVGLSSERLELVTRGLEKHVDAGDIAGVVAAVVRHGKLVYEAIVDDD